MTRVMQGMQVKLFVTSSYDRLRLVGTKSFRVVDFCLSISAVWASPG